MRRFFTAAVLGAFLTCSLAPVNSYGAAKKEAKSFTVYYVDLQEVLMESNKGKQAKAVIKSKIQTFRKELDKLKKEIQQIQNELKSPVLSKKARTEKENLLQQKILTYQQKQQEAQQQIAELEDKYTREILDEVVKLIRKYRKEKNIPMIVDKRTAGIISADPKYDLTKTIINLYNRESK